MVLADLGRSITSAIQNLTKSPVIDEATLDACLKDIGVALLKHDVNVKIISELRKNIKADVQKENNPDANKVKVIQKAVFENLVATLTPARQPYQLKKGKANVIMFVGLQGAGKTTTCTKLAHLWRRKGFKTALVCADTFRAGAFDQLKQNATKAKIPFYGSDVETDPAKIAADGVREFKKAHYDVIIVDTSGRHMQEAALFEEMRQVAAAVTPDDIIYVMDSHMGQKAEDQAKAFAEAVNVGSVVLTKLDGHAKGGGALSAVAATNAPIGYIGTGEHFDDLEAFDARSFVSKLLGMGDFKGLINTMKDVFTEEDQKNLMANLQKGKFTFRMMADQMRSVLKMGPMGKLAQMAGMGQFASMLDGEDASKKMRAMISIFDSMTSQELDGDMAIVDESRLRRIAQGSGMRLGELKLAIEQQKQMASVMQSMGKMTQAGAGGKPKLSGGMAQQVAAMQQQLKSQGIDMQKLQQQIKSGTPQQKAAAMQKLQQATAGMDMGQMMGNMPGMGGLASMLGGLGGGAGGMPEGMPDMASMMQQMMGGGGPGGGMGGGMMSGLASMLGGMGGGAGGMPGLGGMGDLLGGMMGGAPGGMMGGPAPAAGAKTIVKKKKK